MPEVRRLWRLQEVDAAERDHRLQWLHWRHAYQARAKRGHMRRHTRIYGVPSQSDPPVVVVPGTPPLTDAVWQQIVCYLPPQKPVTGRPAIDHRRVLEGMLWVMRSGTAWRFLPGQFGPWQTIYSRYQRWCKEGIWHQILEILHPEARMPPEPG